MLSDGDRFDALPRVDSAPALCHHGISWGISFVVLVGVIYVFEIDGFTLAEIAFVGSASLAGHWMARVGLSSAPEYTLSIQHPLVSKRRKNLNSS